MKKLSETLTEQGIAFSFPIAIKNANNQVTYWEGINGWWHKREYDSSGNETYYENSYGFKTGTPRASKTCEGKVVEIDGVKYELKAL